MVHQLESNFNQVLVRHYSRMIRGMTAEIPKIVSI